MADQIRATPRSPILGLFSDLVNLPLQYMSAPERTQQSQGVAQFLYGTGIPKTLERASYGDSLFSGAGGLGGTTRMRPETAEALMNVAPFAPVVGRVAGRMIKATEGMPVGMGIKDVGKTGLPSPQSLTMPSVPTVDQMKKYGRTEVVPLSKAVSFQSARNWEKFNAKKGAGDLVAGYGDKPLALRLETGEYVIYDGNHRTDLALQKGLTELPMNVIDVKSYDPTHAGRKPVPPSMSDDELLNSLLGNEVKAPQQAALPTQYPLAPAGTRYEEFGGDLTYMTPDEFLQQVRPLQLDAESLDNIAALRSHVESGGKLDPLHIYASGKEDGRHRAYLAKELGIEKVPVALHGQTPTPIETPPTYSDPFGNTIGSSIR